MLRCLLILVPRSSAALCQGSRSAQSKYQGQTEIPGGKLTPVPPKLQKRFYEVLIVLRAFDVIRGNRIKRPERFSAHEDHTYQELRRSFIDSIAYACDLQKGGDTTTAGLLQQTPQGVVIWLASNRGLGPETVEDVKLMLSEAMEMVRSKESFDREVTLARLVQMSQPRLKTYIEFVARDIDR